MDDKSSRLAVLFFALSFILGSTLVYGSGEGRPLKRGWYWWTNSGSQSNPGNSQRSVEEVNWISHAIESGRRSGRGPDGTDLMDINGDGYPDVVSGWEFRGRTNVYLNPGIPSVFSPWPTVQVSYPQGVPHVEDAAFADLDGDGNVDVLSAMEAGAGRIAIHWAPPPNEILNPSKWMTAILPSAGHRGKQWRRVRAGQIDGEDGIDLSVGSRGGGIYWFEAPSDPRRVEAWVAHRIGGAGWTMSCELVDMDEDGDLDVLYSDRKEIAWYENPGPGSLRVPAWAGHRIAEQHGNRWLTYGDLDNDGMKDVIAADNGTEAVAVWYRREDPRGLRWAAYPIKVHGGELASGVRKAVAVGDLDGDGRNELVLTYKGSGRCVYGMRYRNSPYDPSWEAYPIAEKGSGKYDNVQCVDLDRDGDLDVLTSEENHGLGVIWYENRLR